MVMAAACAVLVGEGMGSPVQPVAEVDVDVDIEVFTRTVSGKYGSFGGVTTSSSTAQPFRQVSQFSLPAYSNLGVVAKVLCDNLGKCDLDCEGGAVDDKIVFDEDLDCMLREDSGTLMCFSPLCQFKCIAL